MMQTICCAQCGKANIEFGTVSVNVTFRYHHPPCDGCQHNRIDTRSVFFCSYECLMLYSHYYLFKKEIKAVTP